MFTRSLLLSLTLFLSMPIVGHAFDLVAVARQARPAVVALEVFNLRAQEIGSGTAFAVGEDGKILTCRHVIENAARATATLSDGRRVAVRRMLADDTENDLALLQLEPASHLPALKLCGENDQATGSNVAVVGFPFGLGEMWSGGIVAGMPELFGHRMLRFTAAIARGASGAPVLNRAGQVVGLVQGQFDGNESARSFAVPVAALRDLLERNQKEIGAATTAIAAPATPTSR